MQARSFLTFVFAGLLCFLFLGCSDDITARNKKLVSRVVASFAGDVKAKSRFRKVAESNDLTDKGRIKIVYLCAKAQLEELRAILRDYQPEARYKRGPYGTGRMWFSADSGLLYEMKALVGAYDDLEREIRMTENISLDRVHALVARASLHKRYFYDRARLLGLVKDGDTL